MDFFLDMLQKPFTQLRLGQQISAVVILLLCVFPAVASLRWAVRRIKKNRLHWRHPLVSPIQVTWQDQAGGERQDRGRCLDVSKGGLKMELPHPIEVGASIRFYVVHSDIVGAGLVRHCTKTGSKYVIGVEFTDAKGAQQP
jgi:PilZ domain-containing protein